ncbi:MAG: PilZ domain-containing protein [Planctomycetota bacterium]
MATDPWARPTVEDLNAILESISNRDPNENTRDAQRLELCVPAEVKTLRGNTVSAMTREISRTGLGLIHRGAITPGPIRVRMASDERSFDYDVTLEWCTPVENGMFLSGGRFEPSPDARPQDDDVALN